MTTDLETRITEALRAGADDSPSIAGLSAGARERARARRRRRRAGGVVAAVLVVVGVGLGVPALRGDGPGPANDEDPSATRDDWHTVTLVGFDTEVPQGWEESTVTPCLLLTGVVAVPPGADPCADERPRVTEGAVVEDFSVVDFVGQLGAIDRRDGLYVGEVNLGTIGELVLRVASPDRDVVRDVLAAVRPVGDSAPVLGGWHDEPVGLAAQVSVPSAWGEDTGFGVSLARAPSEPYLRRRDDGGWVGVGELSHVRVVAPTLALAEVVLGSAVPID